MLLVINELIFHDLLMDNGPVAFKETEGFVKRLFGSDDRIVMPDEDRWKRKAYQLMTEFKPRAEAGKPVVSSITERPKQMPHPFNSRFSGSIARRVRLGPA